MSLRDLWDNNKRSNICVISRKPISMFNGKFLKALLKETPFDKALYCSDPKEKKRINRNAEFVKFIPGQMSRCLYGTIC